ncbi:MAG: TSUP family transporter [Bacteroidota bacterium]
MNANIIQPYLEVVPANTNSTEQNNLFPVFFKLETMAVLIVGGGNIAMEKLQSIVQNAPATPITIVAIEIKPAIYAIAAVNTHITIVQQKYEPSFLKNQQLVFVAVNNIELAATIRADAHAMNLLVNVADKPALCDFYLSSVVQKGNLKIAISTNGKSPTIAKRLKELLYVIIPDDVDALLYNMQHIRNQLTGNFADKVKHLNQLTQTLVAKNMQLNDIKLQTPREKKWQQIVKWCLFAFVCMIFGHTILSLIPAFSWRAGLNSFIELMDWPVFTIMLLTGFIAQLVDGSLGMGYGTISTTILLANGVNPAIVSSRVHAARVFSSGVSGYQHHRFGNINKKLFKSLVVPGMFGAVLGATLASMMQQYAFYIKIPLSFYTLFLGYHIIRKAFAAQRNGNKVNRAGWLAGIGGFTDAFAGGGWGTLVTSTLISKRKNPRYVIGSVCLAEFFVVFASALTFFIVLKHIPLFDVAGLIIGGVLAAPVAAKLAGRLPVKKMYVAVGIMVMITSIITLWKALHFFFV